MQTVFKIGSKKHTLKYQRKMSEGEVQKMKSFVTVNGEKLLKTNKFKITDIYDSKDQKIYEIVFKLNLILLLPLITMVVFASIMFKTLLHEFF